MSRSIALLTAKQKKFYDILKRHIQRNGQSPTVMELAASMKLSSPRAVSQYLEALERKGLIARGRYQRRGIRLTDAGRRPETVNLPVIASAGCDNVSVFAQRSFGDYICVASEILQGRRKESIVCIKAVGDSMGDAGINEGDYVLVEMTDAIYDNDLVAAVIDGFAVIKKIEYANNAVVLKPVSSDPDYKPIILRKDFRVFGKVLDVIRMPQKGDIEIVPVYYSG